MTSNNVTFTVSPRSITGKAVKKLRRDNQIPANIHGDLKEPIAVTADLIPFKKLYTQVGDTGLIYLSLEGEKNPRPVLVDEVEVNPVTDEVIHVVFKQVSLKEKVSAEVPLEFIGETDVPESVLMTIRDSVEVEALPTDLPDKIEVDISVLTEIGQNITLADLSFDKAKVTLMVEEEDLEKPVVLLQAQREEEPEEEPETPEGEEGAETDGEEQPTEGGEEADTAAEKEE